MNNRVFLGKREEGVIIVVFNTSDRFLLGLSLLRVANEEQQSSTHIY